MRVKKIELLGFKSFADRTEIHLDQGATCVVGPNGCGKSNISDAIRWVFGERSAKLLRGTKMEDVIFNGTEFRKPMGIAEVSLAVDNEDHRLPIEYNEVVFTRRLSRSGQSEYFINKTPCRLKDILDLILDTGMGSNAYSMIEQGRVDFIINSNAEERRFLIEEAAGISKYKVKKEEALRKLERTEQNLARIHDIVTEVQRNISYAEKQAKRAERYKTQFEELKRLEIQKAFLDLDGINDQKTLEEESRNNFASSLRGLEEELKAVIQEEQGQKALLESVTADEKLHSNRYFELRSEAQSTAQKREFNQVRVREYETRRPAIEKEVEILRSEVARLEEEMRAKQSETESLLEGHCLAKEKLEKEKSLFSECETRHNQKSGQTQTLKTLLFENASESANLKNEASRLRFLLEREVKECAKRKEALKKLLEEKSLIEERKRSYEEELAGVREVHQGGDGKKKKVKERLSEIQSELDAIQKETGSQRMKLQEVEGRLRLLEELSESAEEMERRLLTSVSTNHLQGKLIKTLREVLHVQKGYETAVEAVLGAFAQGVIAEDVETAKGLIEEMTQSHMGPYGILIQSLVKPGREQSKGTTVLHPSIRHSVQAVVTIQEGFGPLFEPMLSNAYIVEEFTPESLSELLLLAREAKLVTKQGILLGPESHIFFRNGKLSSEQGFFHRQSEIRKLKEAAGPFTESLKTLKAREENLAREWEELEKELNALEEENLDARVRREATESLLVGVDERLKTLSEQIRVLQFEESESEKESTRIQVRIGEIEPVAIRLEEKRIELERQYIEAEASLKEMQHEREEKLQILTRLKTLFEGHEDRLQSSRESKELLETQIAKTCQRMTHLGEESQELGRRLEELAQEKVWLAENQREIDDKLEEVEQCLRQIQGQKAFQEARYRDLTSRITDREKQAHSLREQAHQSELKLMDLGYREKSVCERIEQTYHVRMTNLARKDYLGGDGGGEEGLEERIKSLKERVETYGPVNLLAVEEYEELRQRYEFLTGQEKDLADAREALLEAIRKINRTTKTLFAETFAKAQQLFQEYYRTLFGGGHAELVLLEEEEGGEAGIDVVVRPPGKKPQHISLLSGGEKALTAIALLFSLFRIKPSPLCVLDEVDAPLDEANVDRFVQVLKTFLDSTQFLIITHNRKTIAMGDSLYGVTMEEAGVSKLVSVKVAPVEEGAAAAP